MTKRKNEALTFDLKVLPPPTVPPASWAEARADYKRGPVITSPEDVAAYFKQYIGGKDTEAFLTMYLDHRNHVLDVVLNQEGTVKNQRAWPTFNTLDPIFPLGYSLCKRGQFWLAL